MQFDTDYLSAIDKKASDIRYDPHNIGFSHGVFQEGALGAVKTGIFAGSPNVEITFFGAGKGSQKSTPESYGKSEREEMRELARVNDVNLTIHATPNWGQAGGSLSGYSPRGNAFSDESKEIALQEIERTLDFAADAAGGGPVVFHIDGFPREIFSAGGETGDRFKAYPDEAEKAPLTFVDKETGKIQAIRRDQKISMPEKNRDGSYKRDPETGTYQVKRMTFDQIKDNYQDLTDKEKGRLKEEGVNDALGYLFYEYQQSQVEQLQAREREFMHLSDNAQLRYDGLKNLQDTYQEQMKTAEHKGRVKTLLIEELKARKIAPPPDDVDQFSRFLEQPLEFVKKEVEKSRADSDYYQSGAIGLRRDIEQTKEQIGNNVEITDYGVREEADTIARAAIKAYDIERAKNLKEPLWVAPENWLIESYGSHPQEFKRIIQESRANMTERLQKKGYSESKAKKIAKDHIKATFDIGHMNMWRRFHDKDDDDFREWMKDQVKDLVKDDIIGHVHLTDNFGFHDEHLELGEGNAPIQDFMKILKEAKFKGKMIAEPGGQRQGQAFRVWTSALRLAGSPIYRVDAASRAWTDIEGSYFGRTHSPNFIVGEYAPTKDWTLWSEVPFE